MSIFDISAPDVLAAIETSLSDRMERMLFSYFVINDTELTCSITAAALPGLIKSCFPTASPATLDSIITNISSYQDDPKVVLFSDILAWWREVGVSEEASPGKNVPIPKPDQWLSSVRELNPDTKHRLLNSYKTIMYEVCLKDFEGGLRNISTEERATKEAIEDPRRELGVLESEAVENLTRHVAIGDQVPVEKLGDIAALVGINVSAVDIFSAKKAYGSYLGVDDVLTWWAARVDKGDE
eukprot:PhF_6_TR8647/c0_g1_i1/m.13508